jgi:hypothetical protein
MNVAGPRYWYQQELDKEYGRKKITNRMVRKSGPRKSLDYEIQADGLALVLRRAIEFTTGNGLSS